MKRNKKVEIPDNMLICDGCLTEFETKEIHNVLCGKKLCKYCLELHDECQECKKKFEFYKVMNEQKICEDCGKETEVLTVCTCKMKLCKYCHEIHVEEHLKEEYEDDIEEDSEYDRRPPRNNWN